MLGSALRVLQCFDVVGKEEAVALVPKSFWGIFAWLLAQQGVEAVLPKVAEGGMANVMSQGNGSGQLLVQSQVLGDGGSHGGHVKDMLHAGAHMVVFGCKEYLGLVLESTEGLAVEQASVVPLEFGADVVVAGIQLVLPLDCLLPVGMTFSTGFLNKCVLHS